MALKKQFNQIKYIKFPWLKEIHRDAHSQPFEHLGIAWSNYFQKLKNGTIAKIQKQRMKEGKRYDPDLGKPNFKRKGKCKDSFYLANDKFKINDKIVKMPKIGNVKMIETLRFEGKILSATVSKEANKWYIAIQIEVTEEIYFKQRMQNSTTGIDLGITAAVTLSSGKKILSPKPLKKALRRLKIRQRKLTHKIKFAKIIAGLKVNQPFPKGAYLKKSNNFNKQSAKLNKTHKRIKNIRLDWTHKLTSKLCRENQAIVMEDLNVSGMLKNHRLARAINDIGFGRIRQQLFYKASRYGVAVFMADRWYPSSKKCSNCGHILECLPLSARIWQCPLCGFVHDRDVNAAINLKQLVSVTTLPMANLSGDGNTIVEIPSEMVGKVTPVRYERSARDGSGQEQNFACNHLYVHFESSPTVNTMPAKSLKPWT